MPVALLCTPAWAPRRVKNRTMSDVKIARLTGGVRARVQFPLWLVGSPPSVYDGSGFAQHLFDIKHVAFTRILMDQGIYASMLIFAAGLRHLGARTAARSEWHRERR